MLELAKEQNVKLLEKVSEECQKFSAICTDLCGNIDIKSFKLCQISGFVRLFLLIDKYRRKIYNIERKF